MADLERVEGRVVKFNVQLEDRSAEGFVFVRDSEGADTKVIGYVNLCTHQTLQLDNNDADFFTVCGSFIQCKVHGAMFDPMTGNGMGGPCRGTSLRKLNIRVEDGEVVFEGVAPPTTRRRPPRRRRKQTNPETVEESSCGDDQGGPTPEQVRAKLESLDGFSRLQGLGLVKAKTGDEKGDPATEAAGELRDIIRTLAAREEPGKPDRKAMALHKERQAEADEELRLVADRMKKMQEKLARQRAEKGVAEGGGKVSKATKPRE
jgi:nitrite reductase/ring-hydroxylating ferredoxin subunit